MQAAIVIYLLGGAVLALYKLFSLAGDNDGYKPFAILITIFAGAIVMAVTWRNKLYGPIWNPLTNEIRRPVDGVRLLLLTPTAFWGFSSATGVPLMPFLEEWLRYKVVEFPCYLVKSPDELPSFSAGMIMALVATFIIVAITVKGTRVHGEWIHVPTITVLVSGVALLPSNFLLGTVCLLTFTWLSPRMGAVFRPAGLLLDALAITLAGRSLYEWTKLLFCSQEVSGGARWIMDHAWLPTVVVVVTCWIWLFVERKSAQ